MIDWTALSGLLSKNGFDNKEIKKLASPIRISIGLLRSEQEITKIIQRNLVTHYAKEVSDIWMPIPGTQDNQKKKEWVQKHLPKVFDLMRQNLEQLKTEKESVLQSVSYESLRSYFENLESTFRQAEVKMSKNAILTSNPYLTAFIKNSYEEGKLFQTAAKISSSVETTWGTWIQKIITLFNGEITFVGAGGFDYVLRGVAYDIKSGPNVMNKGMVEGAKEKRRVIRELAGSGDLRDVVAVKDFKVAISYGRESLAGTFMGNSGGLIIFGANTWRDLTGDEWNAYRVFLWQLKYKIEKLYRQTQFRDPVKLIDH